MIQWWFAVAGAATFELWPGDDVEGVLDGLVAGDEAVLHGGTYTLTDRFDVSLYGTAAMPIVIRAATGELPHLHRPDASQNLFDIDDAAYLEIRGIEFSGGSAGLRISGASHLTIEDCEVHDTADVAIRANDTGVLYESLVIRGNHVHDTDGTGEGMYLGCNDNGCQVANSVIEGNWVHHTNGPTVSQGDGIELKEGSYDNVIRDNVIHDTNYPCILTYSVAGNGGPNVVERNVMWNCGDHGIQSAADAILRNNIILSANADGIAMQPHQAGSPSNLVVVHNTVLEATNDALSVRSPIGSVVIANNALYADNGDAIYASGTTSWLTVTGNVGEGSLNGVTAGLALGVVGADFVSGHYLGVPPIDVFPATGGALVGAGDAGQVALDDFNGSLRNGAADAGAYLYDAAGNPGWEIAEGFKDLLAVSTTPTKPPVDTGTTGTTPTNPTDPTPSSTDGTATDTGGDGGLTTGDDTKGGCGCNDVPAGAGTAASLGLWMLARRRTTR